MSYTILFVVWFMLIMHFVLCMAIFIGVILSDLIESAGDKRPITDYTSSEDEDARSEPDETSGNDKEDNTLEKWAEYRDAASEELVKEEEQKKEEELVKERIEKEEELYENPYVFVSKLKKIE